MLLHKIECLRAHCTRNWQKRILHCAEQILLVLSLSNYPKTRNNTLNVNVSNFIIAEWPFLMQKHFGKFCRGKHL